MVLTNQELLDMGSTQGDIDTYNMQKNRELIGVVDKIDLDNDAGIMSTDLDIDYESITDIKKTGVSAVKMDGQDAIVDFDIKAVKDGTTPFPKYDVTLDDGTKVKRQLATSVQSDRWENRDDFSTKYDTLASMPLDQANERLIEIFGSKTDAIKAVMFGLEVGFNADEAKENLLSINTDVQLKNSDFDLADNEEIISKKRIDITGWVDGQPVFSDKPKYALIDDDVYLDSLATTAMVYTNKVHVVDKNGQIVEEVAEVQDLSFDEMRELSYQQSILGKVGLIQDCADDQSKCKVMVEEFYRKSSALGDQAWYERLITGTATFGLDFPVYSGSCMFGGGFAAAAAAPTAARTGAGVSAVATPVAGIATGAAIEAAAFSTGCWTMSLATHGSVTSVLDDILESFANDTDLDGAQVFVNAVKEFGAQAVIGFLTSKFGSGAKSWSEMIPALSKMTRGIAAPTVEIAVQATTLAQGEHIWQKVQGNVPGWFVDRQGLLDSAAFLFGMRGVHLISAKTRQSIKTQLNTSEKYIASRLHRIQIQYGIPHEVIKNYAESHPTLAQEIVAQLSEAPRIVNGKEVYIMPDLVRDMLLSISAHHSKSTSQVSRDGGVITMATNKLQEINGKLVRKYIIQESGTKGMDVINNRSEIIFEPVGNGQLKLVSVKGNVKPEVIQEIIKKDNRTIVEVAEGIEGLEGLKLEQKKTDDVNVSEVDAAVYAVKLEIEDLVSSIEKLDPKVALEVEKIVKDAAEGTFGKDQIQESIERLDASVKEQIKQHSEAADKAIKDMSVEYREKTGFHTTEYLESIGIIEDIISPVESIKVPDMKTIHEGVIGEHYFLAEHVSNNPDLLNTKVGVQNIIHVGSSKQSTTAVEQNSHKVPYKILVKTINPLMKNGEIVQVDTTLRSAEHPQQIAEALRDMGIITESDFLKVDRPNKQGSAEALNQIMRDMEIDSIYYKDENGNIGAMVLPENISILHKIKRATGQGESITGRDFSLSDPENGAVNFSLPELVTIAQGVLDGKYPIVAKYLGEGVRGKATTGKEKSAIEIAAELGKDPKALSRVLAHEIGHIADPSIRHELMTGKQTNILGRVIHLKGHVKEHFKLDSEGTALENKDIHNELYALSKKWRPFDESQAGAEYLHYRNDPAELYADFVSAFLVNPVWAEKTAPIAFESFINFIESNPKFLKNYNNIQNDIALHGSSNAVVRKKVRNNMELGSKTRAEQVHANRAKDWVAWSLIDSAHGIVRDVKKAKKIGMNIKDSDNPIYKYRDYLYRNSLSELYLDTISVRIMSPNRMKGATELEFGEYLLYQRIAKGDRMEIISTEGIDKKTATELLLELDTRYPHLKDLVGEYWTLRQDTILKHLEGSNALDPKLKRKIIENKYYSTTNIIEHLDKNNGKGTGLKFYGQIGSFKAQENPLLSTIESDLLLINGLLKNNASQSIINMYIKSKKTFPDEFIIEKADTEVIVTDFGKIRRPIESKDPELGLITLMHNGKMKGYYVDKFTAMAFKTDVGSLEKVLRQIFRVNNYFREIYTIANPGFIMETNPLRDIHRLVLNMPDRKRDMILYYKDVSMFLQTLTYGIPEGARRVSGKGSARTDKMRKELSLISVAEPWGEHEGKDPLTGLLHRYHGADSKKWNEIVKHPFDSLFRKIHDMNAIMETATKVVADRYLEKHFPNMSKERRVDIIRTQAGSPAHLIRGGASAAYNNILLFSNAMKEGYRGDWEAAKGRYGEWSYHAMMSGVVPKVIMFGMAQGYMFPGQSIEDAKINATIMSMIPDRVKTNYIVIPLGLRKIGNNEDGSPIYKAKVMLKPVDETSRLLGGVTHRLLNQHFGNATNEQSGVLEYMGGETPQVTPAFEIINNVFKYFIKNENPVDDYTGQPIVGADKFKAGMGDAEFYNWMWKELGGSIFLEDNPLVDLTKPKDLVDDYNEIPIISGMAKRLIREYDSRDVPFAYTDKIATQKAAIRVNIESGIIKGLTNRELSDAEIEAISSVSGRELKRKITTIVKKGTSSAWTSQYLSADEEEKIFMKYMAIRLYTETGNKVARQFLEGLMEGEPDDVTNTKLYPGYKKMMENMQKQE